MTQFQNLSLIFLRLLWQVLGLLFDNTLLVFWLMLTTLCLVFSVVTWLLVTMLHKGLALVSTQAVSVESTPGLEAVKSNTQELYHFSKSLKQQSNVVLKMVSEVALLLFTSQFGTKKLKTFWSSKITKVRKIIGLEN